ncbi:MOSC domain-containing protein [Rhodoplanes roseus]|uniref:MOSC domain-containing protein n=1 Tax=Rhodoplanes roseus TaxID=29409 RepID=A0A327KN63_9BRAD|nr:MOSC domain-containing protein [Rhodoplanes roseus]RAI39877.1 hypothetical protein CH341_24955 [Rhodoplanes roseus]
MPTDASARPIVLSVHASGGHAFSKPAGAVVRLIENWGVEGDAHAGLTDQHVYHVKRFGPTPNLRQVHLIAAETLDDLATQGHTVRAGELGENISTRNLDLLALPTGTRLSLGPDAVIELTGLRNPCVQIDKFQRGLTKLLVDRGPDGPVLKCGVMSIVIRSGEVRPDDVITIALPSLPHTPLAYVPPVAATHGSVGA